MDDSNRLSIACLYNMRSAQPGQSGLEPLFANSPVSPLQTPINNDQRSIGQFSPVEQVKYSDEKIVLVEPTVQKEQVLQPNRRPSQAPEVVLADSPSPVETPFIPSFAPPGYASTQLPSRPPAQPFWKRHILWILGITGFGILLIGIGVGVVGHNKGKSTKESAKGGESNESNKSDASITSLPVVSTVTNNTINSVASSGVFMKDGVTWNTHVVSQNSTGDLNLQISLDGQAFQPSQPVKLSIPPRKGSPLAATTAVDSSPGVVMLNIFYIAGANNITMSAISCSSFSNMCSTVSNSFLPTKIAPSNYTGLAAVNVRNAQDWRVYYHDKDGQVSELQGDNNSGFNLGKLVGGTALNASSIAAVNINSTTNNINVFYVDALTQALFTIQYTAGRWTKPAIITRARLNSWNPLSGLGAAYTVALDQLRVFFNGLDAVTYEFLGSNASKTVNASWSEEPGRTRLRSPADHIGAPLAAVGWRNQARFFQVKGQTIAEASLTADTDWKESFINRDGLLS